MELIREQYGLTALRLGYTQGSRSEGERQDVTCSLRSPDAAEEDWWVPADAIPLLAPTPETRVDLGIEAGLVDCVHRLEASRAVDPLQQQHEPLWLAVTAEHPLLPGVAWERGLDALGVPLLRLPGQLNTAPTPPPPRPRVVVCVSAPRAKGWFGPEPDQVVRGVLDAVEQQQVGAEVHVFADVEWTPVLENRFGSRAHVHDPVGEGPHETVLRSVRPGGEPLSDRQPWLKWIADQMKGRIDILHLIGHGYLATGQGAFAVAEAPDENYDTRIARFIWPQQLAELMTSTGAWGLVATAVAQNYSVPGLRLLTSQVASLRSAATAFLDMDELEPDARLAEAVYRLLLRYPAPPPPTTRSLTLIMHPGRFGLEAPATTSYRPARTELADWVDSGQELPAWAVGAQHQIRQWETELSFDSVSGQVESTRTALEVAKVRLDEVMRTTRQSGGPDMTLVVDFKEFGSPVQVLFGLANSAGLGGWQCDAVDSQLLAAIDQLPWGQRPPETPPAVREAGRLLRTKLAGVAELQAALIDAFATGALGARPLHFRAGKEPAVEAVPFEALWDEHIAGFACLAPTWPIARIPADVTPPAGPFTMERSVRIAAVVAAEGIDPMLQVDALLKGCTPPPGLRVELTVLTTRADAIARVNTFGVPGWSAQLVPATSGDLILRLRGLQPHLLHVFCHGTADGPRLLVAQRDDLAVLELSAESFADLAKPSLLPPWLVTLNCCEGAAPGEQTVSLASGLVRNGLPAVLGMRKAIDARMADPFCGNVYQAALARLAEIAAGGRAPAPLNWSEVLAEPRRRLCAGFGAPGAVADRQKEWTMPVLYVASPDLQLRGRPTVAREQMDDQQVKNDVATIAMADHLEGSGNLPPQAAATMRDPAIDRLYPNG